MNFPGQIIAITGASSGIGEALAFPFAREGAQLVPSSPRTDELERVRRACARPDDHFVVSSVIPLTKYIAAVTSPDLRGPSRVRW